MATTSAAAKRQLASVEQLRAMVDLLAENPGMASGKFQQMHGRTEYQNMWLGMMEKLNAMGGATKTVEQWQTVWKDLISRTSLRCRDRKRQQALTGNHPIDQAPLSEVEMRVLSLIGVQYVEGDESVADTMPMEEEFQILMEEGQDFPCLAVTPSSDNGAQSVSQASRPTTPAETPRRAPKRKHRDDEVASEFLKVAKEQAEALTLLAENSNKMAEKQADALKEIAANNNEVAERQIDALKELVTNNNKVTEEQTCVLKELVASHKVMTQTMLELVEGLKDHSNVVYLLVGTLADRNQ